MRRVRWYISLAAACLLGSVVYAQHLPQYSQYLLNEYAVNPAVVTAKKDFQAITNHRYQWVGLVDAPRTFTLSLFGPHKNEKMGFGGFLYTDIVGPTRRLGAQFSYAYQISLTEKIKLSMGVSAGALQYLVDGGKIILKDQGDHVLGTSLISDLVFDSKIAFYLYSDRFWVGATAPQFLRNQLSFEGGNSDELFLSRLSDHYILTGGYRRPINDLFDVEVSTLLKYVKPAPLKVDVAVRGFYKKKYWLGLAYRTNDAVNLMLGLTLKQNLSVGYSYDYTTTRLRNYSNGTHELMLAIKFAKKKDL